MSESFRTRLMRFGFNLFPAFRRTGGCITHISQDLQQVRIKVPLNWKTRNYVGTIFGGSMYGAIDPIYMVMFMKLLGEDYIVWDKSATIQHKRPGRSSLHASFILTDEELSTIREQLAHTKALERTYRVELLDHDNQICALIDKTLLFRKRKQPAARKL